MSDFNSSLPVRTQTNGDVAVKVVDGTTVSQALAIDASGRVTIKLDDGSGNAITSQANGIQRALDVGINVLGVQIDPRQIRALTSADVVSVVQSTSPWVTQDAADGPVTPGTVAGKSILIGGQFNTALPTLTNGQQSAAQFDSSGRLIISPLSSASIVTVSNLPTTVDTNYGSVGASTLRSAAQIGNATGAANFGNGATGAQTLRVAANLAVAGADVSSSNPVPVSITAALVGTSVNNYNTAAAVAANATSNHTYTITTGKTFQGKKIHASASGKLKIEVQVSPDGSTYSTLWVGFNSTATPNIDIDLDQLVFLESGTGSTVRVIRTNLDLSAQDVYSTISGQEV